MPVPGLVIGLFGWAKHSACEVGVDVVLCAMGGKSGLITAAQHCASIPAQQKITGNNDPSRPTISGNLTPLAIRPSNPVIICFLFCLGEFLK